MPNRAVDPRFPAHLRALLAERRLSYAAVAARSHYSKSYVYDLAIGRKIPTRDVAQRIDDALEAGGVLVALVRPGTAITEIDAVELGRRVAASDISEETLVQLEAVVDELAVRYSNTPPDLLLPQIRQHLGYVARLLDGRTMLTQHRRLLVAGGWLSLLGATVQIDLRDRVAGRASLAVARDLAGQAGQAEIHGWVLETQAWSALTAGDLKRAAKLSQQAQAVAPRGSSAHIQATAQEARVWAQIGDRARTRDALARTARLVSPLAPPDRPEHHYRYDPSKATAYTATTLASIGDPAAEDYARGVLVEMSSPGSLLRPRRVATARLDLALALLPRAPDEATAVTLTAITSGWVVPSNWWRVSDVMRGVDRTGLPESVELREAYETYRPATP